MSTTALVSVQEYLARTEKPNCEYEDGVLHPKALPTTPHSVIQYLLLRMLGKQGAHALPELTVHVTANTFLVPDVAVVREFQFPYPTDPALLCIEILSPEDRVGAMLAKCEKYHAWGVPDCWVIDPEKPSAWTYPQGGEPMRLDASGTLHADNLSVSLNEWFSALPK